MDKETQKIISEGEAIAEYVKSKAWTQVKEIFTNHILDLQSIRNIKKGVPTTMARELEARNLAVEYLMDILREVEGRAQQHEANKTLADDVIQTF